MQSSQVSLKKSRKFFCLSTAEAQLHLPFASSQRSTSSQSPAGPLVITAFFVSEQLEFFLSSYLQPVVKNCKHVIGSHAPIIDWAETAQLDEHDIMFTFDTEALHPSIQVWPGVGGLCLFDVVERAMRRFFSLEPLVEFPVRLLHLVLSTQLTQYGGSFFEVTWGLSTGLQCASELANPYLDVLDSHVWQGSEGALKCFFRYIDDDFWSAGFAENLSPRVAVSVEWLE